MISRLSARITKALLKRNIILYEEKELYDYGLFMIISYIMFFLISILFGVILNIPYMSLLFFFVFCFIRSFAGGIHASTEIKCDIITTISIFISEMLIRIFVDYNLIKISFVMLILSSISLIIIKPVASSQKEISQQENMRFHKKVIFLSVFCVLVSIISLILNFECITISLSIGLSFANLLLVLGKIQQKSNERQEIKGSRFS